MADQFITLQLEIPPGVDQQEVWALEEQLQQIEGIATELREPRDLVSAAHLFIQVTAPYVIEAVAVAGGINTLHDLAQHIYHFLHPKKQEPEQQSGKTKVVLITKKKRIELYGFSVEEIKKIIGQ